MVFYNRHKFNRYPGEIKYKRFDPVLSQSLTWKRLEDGTFSQDDVTWLKHECSERDYELKFGSGYNAAHEHAQSLYDGDPWKYKI